MWHSNCSGTIPPPGTPGVWAKNGCDVPGPGKSKKSDSLGAGHALGSKNTEINCIFAFLKSKIAFFITGKTKECLNWALNAIKRLKLLR